MGKGPPPSSKIVIDEEVDGAKEYAIAIAAIAAKFTKVKQKSMPRRPRCGGVTAAAMAGLAEMSPPRLARIALASRGHARRALLARAMRVPIALRAVRSAASGTVSGTGVAAGAAAAEWSGTAGGAKTAGSGGGRGGGGVDSSTAMPISTVAVRGDSPTNARISAKISSFVRLATPPVPGETGSPVDSIVSRSSRSGGFDSSEATAARACRHDSHTAC